MGRPIAGGGERRCTCALAATAFLVERPGQALRLENALLDEDPEVDLFAIGKAMAADYAGLPTEAAQQLLMLYAGSPEKARERGRETIWAGRAPGRTTWRRFAVLS